MKPTKPPTHSPREELALRCADRVVVRTLSPRTPTQEDPRPRVWREEERVVGTSPDALLAEVRRWRAAAAQLGASARSIVLYVGGPDPTTGEMLLAQIPLR